MMVPLSGLWGGGGMAGLAPLDPPVIKHWSRPYRIFDQKIPLCMTTPTRTGDQYLLAQKPTARETKTHDTKRNIHTLKSFLVKSIPLTNGKTPVAAISSTD